MSWCLMSDFVRLPAGEGMIRVQYGTAEWDSTKEKLILKGPIEWYCEGEPSNKGAAKDSILMIDAVDVKFPVTNPIRFGLEWGDKESDSGVKIPDWIMGKPLDAWEELTPTQGKSRSGGYKGGKPKPKRSCDEIDALHNLAVAKTVDMLAELEIKPESDLKGFSALVAQRFIAYNEQSPTTTAANTKPEAAPPAEAPPEIDDSQIPF